MCCKFFMCFAFSIFFANTTKSSSYLLASSKSRASTCEIFQIRSPFQQLQYNASLIVFRESESQLAFILMKNRLHEIVVSQRGSQMIYLGELMGIAHLLNAVQAAIVATKEYLLLSVASLKYVEIYQIQKNEIWLNDARNYNTTTKYHKFELLQRLEVPGYLQKVYLTKRVVGTTERILLILSTVTSKHGGKYLTYEWFGSYFNPLERISVPAFFTNTIAGEYLISGRLRKSREKVLITVYEIQGTTLKLVRKRSLNADPYGIQAIAYRNCTFLTGCKKKYDECTLYQMIEGNFVLKRVGSREHFHFTNLDANNFIMVGANENSIIVYFNNNLNCLKRFNTKNVGIRHIIALTNQQEETYLLLHIGHGSNALLQVVGLNVQQPKYLQHTTEAEMSRENSYGATLDEAIANMTSFLLERKKLSSQVLSSREDLKSTKTKLQRTLDVAAGKIDTIYVKTQLFESPTLISERLENLSRLIQNEGLRHTRSVELGSNLANITQQIRADNLHVANLVYNDDLLKGFHVAEVGTISLIVATKRSVKTKALEAREVIANRSNVNVLHSTNKIIMSDFRVKKLNVLNINNVPWVKFYDALYLRVRDSIVRGRLILLGKARISHLKTANFNGYNSEHLLNLRLTQTVTANVSANEIHASNLEATTVNNFSCSNNINAQNRKCCLNLALEKNDYKRLVVNGSLTIRNLQFKKVNSTQLLVNGNVFSKTDLAKKYLLRTLPQAFRTPVVIENGSITVPSLYINKLNKNLIETHVLTAGSIKSAIPVALLFYSAQSNGNVNCSSSGSKLNEINANVVRHGDDAIIYGNKYFQAAVTVAELTASNLNEVAVINLITNAESFEFLNFTAAKFFGKLIVRQQASIKNQKLTVGRLNDVLLNKSQQRNISVENLTMPNSLHVRNITMQSVNGYELSCLVVRLRELNFNIVLLKDLLVDGHIYVERNLSVTSINEKNWSDYEKSLIRFGRISEISGRKTFLKKVTVNRNLVAPSMNNRIYGELLENRLLNTKQQTITGNFTFEKLIVNNIHVESINGEKTSNFIDLQQPEITIDSNLIVPSINVDGNLKGLYLDLLNLTTVLAHVNMLHDKAWHNLVVLGDVQWNRVHSKSNVDQLFDYLYKNAVTTTKAYTISDDIKLKDMHIDTLISRSTYLGGVDLKFIAEDAFKKESHKTQSVCDEKVFLNYLHFNRLIANEKTQFEIFNGVDILKLNFSFYSRSAGKPVTADLHFNISPLIDDLSLTGHINGLNVDRLFFMDNSTFPPLRMRNLSVDGALLLDNVNNMDLNYLLNKNIQLNGAALEVFGALTFDNVRFRGKTLLKSINGIPITNLVFKKNQHLKFQSVAGVVDGELLLSGPAHIANFIPESRHIPAHLLYMSPVKSASLFWSKSNADADIKRILYYTLEYPTVCEPKTLQIFISERIVYLQFAPENSKLQRAIGGFCIEVQNNCSYKSGEFLSTITINTTHLTKKLSLRNFTKTFELQKVSDTIIFIVLHTTDATETAYGVQIVRVEISDDTTTLITDSHWQFLTTGIAQSFRLIRLTNETILMSNGSINEERVFVAYMYNIQLQRFVLTSAIKGEFGLIAATTVGVHVNQIILSCERCAGISIYTLSQPFAEGRWQFELLQVFQLDANLVEIAPYKLHNDNSDYLLILTGNVNGYYHIFRYCYVQGWIRVTYGYLERLNSTLLPMDLRLAVPIQGHNGFLLCSNANCELTRAVLQL